jgi:hypothetical protein
MRIRKRNGHGRTIVALGCLIATLGGAIAAAHTSSVHLVAGNLVADIGLSFSPTRLPREEYAPLKTGGFVKLRTQDGSFPPPLTHFALEADKKTKFETRGLSTCTRGQLLATTAAQARSACPRAIVGTGWGSGVILFPDQGPIQADSPVTFFNGPEIGGDPTVIVHAHLTVPVPTTYLVPVRIERVHKGSIGYRIAAKIPKIAGGYGSATDIRFKFDRRWSFEGRRLSYVNARCVHPGPHLLGHVGVGFAEGTEINGSLFASCQVR